MKIDSGYAEGLAMDDFFPTVRTAAVQAEPVALHREATTEKPAGLSRKLRKSSYPADFELNAELADAPDYLEAGGSAIIGPDGAVLAGPLGRRRASCMQTWT